MYISFYTHYVCKWVVIVSNNIKEIARFIWCLLLNLFKQKHLQIDTHRFSVKQYMNVQCKA